MFQFRCKFRYCHKMVSVVCLSVCLSGTRVYCDQTVEVRIMQFSINVAQCLDSLFAKFDDEIREESSQSGAQAEVEVVFDRLVDAISRKRCEIELR